MNTAFSFSTSYILDHTHFSECYSQSVTIDTSIKAYYKSIGIFLAVFILIFTELNKYLAWFILCLGVIEALNVYYNKAWWLMRQKLSKAAGNTVNLTINETGVTVKSIYIDSTTLWIDINEIQQTEKGFLLKLTNSTSYISNRCLSDDAKNYIIKRIDIK